MFRADGKELGSRTLFHLTFILSGPIIAVSIAIHLTKRVKEEPLKTEGI